MRYFKSLIVKRKKFYKERSRKGVEAKERKRLESPPPILPLDREGDYQEIIIRGMHFGQYREITYYLMPVQPGQGYCNQYALFYGMGEPLGVMGASYAAKAIFSREFVPVRAMD